MASMLWTHAAFAVWQPVAPAATGAGIAGLVLWLLWRFFIRSEKAQGCAQPLLWVVAGLGVLMVVTAGGYLVIREYSRSNPRAAQDGILLLILLGVLAGFGGLLWVARTTEGSRILQLLWLSGAAPLDRSLRPPDGPRRAVRLPKAPVSLGQRQFHRATIPCAWPSSFRTASASSPGGATRRYAFRWSIARPGSPARTSVAPRSRRCITSSGLS